MLFPESRVYRRNGKLRQLSGRFHTLIRRQGYTVQNLKSPGLSGRVDSTALFAFSNVNVQSVPSQVV